MYNDSLTHYYVYPYSILDKYTINVRYIELAALYAYIHNIMTAVNM